MSMGQDKLVFDTSVPLVENSNVGAFVRSAAGVLITHTTDGAKERLDTSISADAASAPSLGLYADGTAWAAASMGQSALAVRQDAAGPLTGVADGDWTPLQVNALGELKVTGSLTASADFVYAEDTVFADGDLGAFVLNVREDVPTTSTSASGDYQSFKSDLYGRQWVNNSPNNAASHSTPVVDNVGTVAVTALAGRKTIFIQNLDNQAIYYGTTGLTAGNGIQIAARGYYEEEVGPNIPVLLLGTTAGPQSVRVRQKA